MPIIALIGPPAAGKTTVGQALGGRLDIPFIDADEEIERRSGYTPESLAVDLPPQEALSILSKTLGEILGDLPADAVIALPSRIIEVQDAGELLSGLRVVFLDVDLATSFPRTGLGAPRPVGFVTPRSLWHQMLIERRPQYTSIADNTIDVSGATIETIVEQIVALALIKPV